MSWGYLSLLHYLPSRYRDELVRFFHRFHVEILAGVPTKERNRPRSDGVYQGQGGWVLRPVRMASVGGIHSCLWAGGCMNQTRREGCLGTSSVFAISSAPNESGNFSNGSFSNIFESDLGGCNSPLARSIGGIPTAQYHRLLRLCYCEILPHTKQATTCVTIIPCPRTSATSAMPTGKNGTFCGTTHEGETRAQTILYSSRRSRILYHQYSCNYSDSIVRQYPTSLDIATGLPRTSIHPFSIHAIKDKNSNT